MALAPFRRADGDPVERATTLARVQDAHYRVRRSGLTVVRPAPVARLGPSTTWSWASCSGAAWSTFAIAAALTLGAFTVPVYEIYKVGEAPTWLPGLDVLGRLGLPVAVIPHYDNAEGGSHDTRFCYLGERRLQMLEASLPADTFVLGVDSHTALVLDLDQGSASVSGLGGVTVRVDGRSAVFPGGSRMAIEALGEAARTLASGGAPGVSIGSGGPGARAAATAGAGADDAAGLASGPEPIGHEAADLEGAFFHALADGDPGAAVAALLDLDGVLEARIRGGEDSPDLDNARSTFRSLIVRLGEAAAAGGSDPRATIEPFVDALLAVRARARETRDWATADLVRDRLTQAGVEVRDGAEGSSWVLGSSPSG